jgi:ABC-type branched-subunit amino acid transport system permease subunit
MARWAILVVLATLGASVNVTRVIVFCFSAFLAGVARALWASFSGTFGSVAFVSLSSLTLLVVLFVVPGGELVGPVLAALAMNIIPSYVQSQTVSELQPAIFGASAVALMALGTGERLERLPFRLPGWLPRDRTEGRVWARRHGPGAVLEGRS